MNVFLDDGVYLNEKEFIQLIAGNTFQRGERCPGVFLEQQLT